ncbi:hypothetical protein OF83DRAFT_104943 [Amylostereum chailletii]|nr:hypothetical protein OF83DRAFT_104943 [Amylostereum chailletii]
MYHSKRTEPTLVQPTSTVNGGHDPPSNVATPLETRKQAWAHEHGSPSSVSTSSATRPRLLHNEPTLVLPSPPPPIPHPTASFLALNNVKVRDFAYQDVLPPIPSVPRNYMLQQQTPSRPVKRLKKNHDPDDPFIDGSVLSSVGPTSYSHIAGPSSQPLARKPTEPAIVVEDNNPLRYRTVAYMDLAHHEAKPSLNGLHEHRTPVSFEAISGPQLPESSNLHPSQQGQASDLQAYRHSDDLSQSQLVGDSQDNESHIDTPLVTPQGSLHFPEANMTAAKRSAAPSPNARRLAYSSRLTTPRSLSSLPSPGPELSLIMPDCTSPSQPQISQPILPTNDHPISATSTASRYFFRTRPTSPRTAEKAPTEVRSPHPRRRVIRTSNKLFPETLVAQAAQGAKPARESPRAGPPKRSIVR